MKLKSFVVNCLTTLRLIGVLAFIVVTAGTSWAQGGLGGTPHYDISYSGGTYSSSGPYGSYGGNDTGNGPHGGSATTGGPGPASEEPIYLAGPGSASCGNQITATFTWNNAGDDSNEPPSVILVRETASANWAGDSGSCSDGFGHPVTTSTYGSYTGGDFYIVKVNPGQSFTVNCTPTATVSYGTSSPSGLPAGTCSVSYSATYYVLDIAFTGGKGPSDGKQYLIGQKCTAYVTATGAGSLPLGLNFDDTDWSVSGGEPFSNYAINSWLSPYDQWSSTLTNYTSPSTAPSLVCHFKIEDTETVSSHTRITLPSGALPATTLTVDLEKDCTSIKPDSISLGVTIGSPTVTNTSTGGAWKIVTLTPPMEYSGKVVTTAGFGGDGVWSIVQLVTQDRQRKYLTNWQQLFEDISTSPVTKQAMNGTLSLDNTFPYDIWYTSYASDSVMVNYYQGSQDYPSQELEANTDIKAYDVLDSFDDYMMYLPPGAGSLPVPLKKYKWYWELHATRDSSNVWQVTGTNAQWSFNSDFPEFPLWGVQSLNDKLYFDGP